MGTSQTKYAKSGSSVYDAETQNVPIVKDSTLNYLLVGKAGNGKSSSGNAIVGKNVFKSYKLSSAGTKFVWSYKTKRLGKEMCVVDTPGIKDTEHMEDIQNARFARKYMKKAINVCPVGFHAILIFVNVTNTYSAEDKSVITILTDIFGEVMFKFTILIFTHGDNFDVEHNLADPDSSQTFFKLWCKERHGNLGTLLKKCEYRAVLFHNSDRYKLMRDVELLALDDELKNISRSGQRYTERLFEMNSYNRKHLIIKNYLPELEREINEKLQDLKKELLLIESHGGTVIDKAKELLLSINNNGSKYPSLDTLKETVQNLQKEFELQTTNQDKFHLAETVKEVIDCEILCELRSLSTVLNNIQKPDTHKKELNNKAKSLSKSIDKEACGTDKLDNLKKKVEMLVCEIDDLDTKGNGTLTEFK